MNKHPFVCGLPKRYGYRFLGLLLNTKACSRNKIKAILKNEYEMNTPTPVWNRFTARLAAQLFVKEQTVTTQKPS